MKNCRHPFNKTFKPGHSHRKKRCPVGDLRNPDKNRSVWVVKEKLREEVKAATEVYLKAGKKIEKIMDGPAAKIPSVGMKDWGWAVTAGAGELYEKPSDYAEMEVQLNKQLMEGDL